MLCHECEKDRKSLMTHNTLMTQRPRPKINESTAITRKMKNRILAIPTALPAIPPNPKIHLSPHPPKNPPNRLHPPPNLPSVAPRTTRREKPAAAAPWKREHPNPRRRDLRARARILEGAAEGRRNLRAARLIRDEVGLVIPDRDRRPRAAR